MAFEVARSNGGSRRTKTLECYDQYTRVFTSLSLNPTKPDASSPKISEPVSSSYLTRNPLIFGLFSDTESSSTTSASTNNSNLKRANGQQAPLSVDPLARIICSRTRQPHRILPSIDVSRPTLNAVLVEEDVGLYFRVGAAKAILEQIAKRATAKRTEDRLLPRLKAGRLFCHHVSERFVFNVGGMEIIVRPDINKAFGSTMGLKWTSSISSLAAKIMDVINKNESYSQTSSMIHYDRDSDSIIYQGLPYSKK